MNLYPSISPDGQRIVYIGNDGGRRALAMMTSQGVNERFVASANRACRLRRAARATGCPKCQSVLWHLEAENCGKVL